MSEASDLAPTTSHDAGALAHSPPPSTGTSLLDFPPDATFRIWRKPAKGVQPIDEGSLHVGKLIPGDGDHVLVCFATMLPSNWNEIIHHLSVAEDLNLNPLLVSSVGTTQIASALWGADASAGLHGLTKEPTRPTVFAPSQTLMRLFKIDRGSRTRNALVLIRSGHICAEWISGDNGDQPHDWTKILSMVS